MIFYNEMNYDFHSYTYFIKSVSLLPFDRSPPYREKLSKKFRCVGLQGWAPLCCLLRHSPYSTENYIFLRLANAVPMSTGFLDLVKAQ